MLSEIKEIEKHGRKNQWNEEALGLIILKLEWYSQRVPQFKQDVQNYILKPLNRVGDKPLLTVGGLNNFLMKTYPHLQKFWEKKAIVLDYWEEWNKTSLKKKVQLGFTEG